MQVKYLQGDSDWSEASKKITLPPKTKWFGVALLSEGTGKAWLDDVKISDANVEVAVKEAAKPVVQDPKNPQTTGPAPKGKPSDAGWGFWSQYPAAWQQRHNDFLARTKKGDVDVVFFGDSITEGWGGAGKALWKERYAPLKAVNYGIGGDGTRQVIWRIENGELDGLKVKLVVLKIGTNNLYDGGGTDPEVAEGVAACVRAVRSKQPQAKVLLLGILPRQNKYFCDRIERINAIVAELDDGKTVRYLDMRDAFLDSPGKVKADRFMPDQLHLAPKGYEVWAETMQPLFDEMMRD